MYILDTYFRSERRDQRLAKRTYKVHVRRQHLYHLSNGKDLAGKQCIL